MLLLVLLAIAWGVIIVRLFTLQVLRGSFYQGLASGQRELFQELSAERGEIFAHDRQRTDDRFPIATNRLTYTIYAVPTEVRDPARTAKLLAPILGMEADILKERLAKPNDPYEPLKRQVVREERDAALALGLPGVAAEQTLMRYYPDGANAAHLTGFVGEDADGRSGRYGLEGAFDDLLKGTSGFREAERDPRGRWIVFGRRVEARAEDGADLILTIERPIQIEVCRALARAVEAHGAAGGTIVVIHPMTGMVRAMCSVPSFDPNRYQETTDIARFRNPAIAGAYEPGSVFKPITMAAALDAGAVEPTTTFTDTGSVTVDGRTITNTDGRVYGERMMPDVLRFSINTGSVFVARALGIIRFRAAVEQFGFGALTDIELSGEVPGDLRTLAHREEIYLATASFGQGTTVTPLQLAVAYAALANGGKLMSPYIVEEIVSANGERRRISPRVVRQVVRSRTATLLQGMLVSVVRDGYPKRAGVPGYRIGGKTGTAQIPFTDRPGYSADTIHTFAGFGPAESPTFAMVVRIDRPTKTRFADSTAAPLFGELAKVILRYDGIPPKAE